MLITLNVSDILPLITADDAYNAIGACTIRIYERREKCMSNAGDKSNLSIMECV